jgi:hypothetical protein
MCHLNARLPQYWALIQQRVDDYFIVWYGKIKYTTTVRWCDNLRVRNGSILITLKERSYRAVKSAFKEKALGLNRTSHPTHPPRF